MSRYPSKIKKESVWIRYHEEKRFDIDTYFVFSFPGKYARSLVFHFEESSVVVSGSSHYSLRAICEPSDT